MDSFTLIDRKVRYMAAAGALILATIIPVLASAAQITERSIELSSSAATATGVTYRVNFVPETSATAAVIEFCDNTPLIGEVCDAPAGFSVASATAAGFTKDAASTANRLVLTTGTITADVNPAIVISGVTNPTSAGSLYARIVTYAAAGGAQAYDSDAVGAHVDDGAVALSITNNIGVSGAVLETMTFCVSGESTVTPGSSPITTNCAADGGGLTPPTLKLGQDVGGVIALNALAVYDGTIFTQISTNAVNGAVVSLKSSATNCGGLLRAGAPSACDIGPAGTTDTITAGEALFGVKTGTASTDADGTVQPFTGGSYDATNYRLNYVGGNTSGVTGPYGDPLLDTGDAPANNKNMPLTFAASVANNTPAGLYSADLSLIATGKF